ncbi:hypothetical protein SAMN06297387_11723 [Streptomyces zhaozhouensis]|uniref:Uncharacterized protein n=1 Tax=Streptomyces zhaozhouensis TaxID=1300267 RepID=A0A286E0L4_9ACTN|nr:hypothetical protein [Streptomyces zhaozhouensis]SOD64457.1 hypothetical protein SAMN06297387_11723 [Streptomyces zhaozhouensis]
MNEHELITRLDGSEHVSININSDGRLLVAISHEFGYRLAEIRGHGVSVTLIFQRDDSEEARHRAAWATYLYRTTGAWWTPCWPPHLQNQPDTVTPAQAGAARIAIHRFRRNGTAPPRAVLLIGAVAALIGAGFALDTLWLALSLAALAVLLIALVPVAGRWVLNGHQRQLGLVERFEAQRSYPSPDAAREV